MSSSVSLRESPAPSATPRRFDVDWLRIFACYLLLLFHVAMVFNPAPFYHVRNVEVSSFFFVLCGFISLWHMPLFFLLAGFSAAQSIGARGSQGFLRERLFKLAIPLVAGCVLYGPLLKYFELRSGLDANYRGLFVSPALQQSFQQTTGLELPLAAPFDQGFLEFWPTFFTDLDRFTWSHLWFIAYLFVFSVLYAPILIRASRRKWRDREFSPAWVYAPILPLALVQLVLRPHFPGLQTLWNDWANIAYYSTYLCMGVVLARCSGFEVAVHREWRRAFGLGLVTVGGLLAPTLGLFSWTPFLLVGSAVAGWCFVVALLGAARAYCSRSHPGLAALRESAFPVYLLHQPVIVALAYGVVGLSVGVFPKFALLLVASVVGTLAVYHGVVKPIAPLRFLHGMKAPVGSPELGGNAISELAPREA